MVRKLLTIIMYSVLALLLLALVSYLARDPLRNALVRVVNTAVSKSLQGSLHIGQLRGTLLTSLVLRDVVLRDQHDVIAQVDTVRLIYNPLMLLQGQIMVSRVQLTRPRLTLIQHADSTWNVTRLFPSAPPPKTPPAEAPPSGAAFPLTIVVESLRLQDGEIAMQTPALPGVRHISGLQLRLRGHLTRQGLQVTLRQLTAHAAPADVELRTFRATVRSRPDALHIDNLRLQTAQTRITADGVLPGGTRPASLVVQLQPLDVTEIGRLLHDDTLHGNLQMTLKAAGPPEALDVQAQLRTGAGQVALQSHINMAATPVRYDGTLAITRFNLAALVQRTALQSDLNLHFRLEGQGLTLAEGHGQAQLEILPSHVGTIALRPSQIDLAARPQHLQIRRFTLDTSVARMTATGEIHPSDQSNIHYQAVADLAHLRSLLKTEAVGGNVQLQGNITGPWQALRTHGTLQASDLRFQDHGLHTLELTYNGTQLDTHPQATAQLQARQIRSGSIAVERLEAQATYDDTARQVRFTTAVHHSSAYGGEAKGTVTLGDSGQEIVLEELVVRLAKRIWRAPKPLEVALGPGRVHLKRFRLVHDDEALELAGALDGQHLQDMRVAITRLDLTAFRGLLPSPELLVGRASLALHLTGTLAEPGLQGELSLSTASPGDLPFERLVTTLYYKEHAFRSETHIRQEGRATLTLQLRLPVELALTNLPVAQRLGDAPVTLRLLIDRPDMLAIHRWHPALPQLTGTLKGTLDLQGTYTALQLATQMQLQQLGMHGVIADVTAPIRLTAKVVTAPSLPELGRMLAQGQLTPTLRQLECRIPQLRAQLPGQATDQQTVQLQDLLLQAHGRWQSAGLEATLDTLRLQAQALDFPRATIVLAGRVTPQEAELTTVHVRLPHSEVQGRGSFAFDSQRLQFHVDLPRVQLSEFVRPFPKTLPSEVQGTVDVQGTLQEPHMVTRLRYAGARLMADLTAQLQETLPRYALTFRLDGLNAARVLPGSHGNLQATLRLHGAGFSGEHRQARLAFRLASDKFSLLPGLASHLDVTVRGDAVQLEALQLQSTPVTVQARGGLSAQRHVDLTYTLTLGDLTPLQPLLGMPIHAPGSLAGDIQGPLQALQTHGTLQLREWNVAAFQGKTIHVDFAASQLFAEPHATLKLRMTEIHGPSLPSTSLSLDATLQSPRGTFTVAVTEGPYAKSLLTGNVLLQDGQQLTLTRLRAQGHDVVWENDGPITAVRDAQGSLQLQHLLLRSADQTITAQGTLAPEGAVAAKVRVQQLHLRATAQAVVPTLSIPDGRLALDLTLQGTVAQPQLEGTLALTSVQWQQQSLGEIRATFGVAAQTLRLDLRWRDQSTELLHAHGTLGLEPAGAVALRVQTPEIMLNRLTPLSPAVLESAGTLALDLRLTGTLAQPQVHGYLEVRDGVLRLAATGERYRDMQVRVLFRGERVEIERWHIGSQSGPLDLTGRIEYTGTILRHVDLAVRAREFTAVYTTDMQAVLSATIDITGSLEEMTVKGKVKIPRGRMRLPDKLTGGPAGVEPWQLTVEGAYGTGPKSVTALNGAASRSQKPVPLPFLRADVSVDIPRNVWVQGSGTAIEVRGTLRVTKDVREPFIASGSIETVRGFATFYGKKFTIEHGRVTFPGTEEIDPILDVTATHKVSSYVVSIHVEGKAHKPELTLSSQPELEQSDIVSLLVFGKTTDRLTSSEHSSLSSQTQAVAGNLVAGQLEKTVGNALGLDVIQVTPGKEVTTGSVGVGRYVTQDIFLSYERSFAEEGGNTVGIEYSLKRNLKLKGSSSDLGESAIDLLWQIEY